MARLIIILMAALAVIAVVLVVGRAVQSAVDTTREASVPKTAQKISYLLLIVLMLGVVSGWLGGL